MATALMPNPQTYKSYPSRETELDLVYTDQLETSVEQVASLEDDLLTRALQSDDFNLFLSDIMSLTLDEEEEDQPTAHAINAALWLTHPAYIYLQRRWTKPRVVPDGSGGLRLTWKHNSKEVRAVIGGRDFRRNYVYRQELESYSAVPNFTAATLCNELAWLYEG